MRTPLILAMKEFRDGLRNRWVAAAILLLAGLTLALTFLGSAPVGTTGSSQLSVTVASLASLSVYLVPLIALMLSFDAIVGEAERGTLLLLLSYPVTRWQLVAGKFLGHFAILGVAIAIGYGAAGLLAAMLSDITADDLGALLALVGSSMLLGAAFLALGTLVSVFARERSAAAGLAMAVWLAMVLLYDLALLGLLLADSSHVIGEGVFAALMILNPADAFRVFNLTLFENVGAVAGLAGPQMAASVSPWVALCAIAGWAVAAGLVAAVRFGAREP
jgi:Cu-processing system permease protein